MAEFHSFDGVTLHYDVEGEGPPVVLLHGFAADTDLNWRQPGIVDALTAAGRRTIALDARGHGRSEKPHEPAAYGNEAMVADVGALFDHLGLEQADVAGYSMGAATALRFALADHRVRRLVLGGTDGGLTATAESMAERGRHIAEGLEAASAADVTDPAARRFRRFADTTGADRLALAAIQRGRRRTPVARDALRRVCVPVLVVCGDADVSPHELAAAVPDGRAAIVPGDHLSAVLQPAFAAEIVRFLT
jgi:pimeloyl-ACP methyl ester carboxylesterase